MNSKKICFITAVNDERVYEECLFYIKNLKIPEDYEVEAIGIRDAYCMTNGYNKAMYESDAKYKIYIHQDVFIINTNFIYDILNLFSDKKIGMIGLCGSKNIPNDGIWWNSKDKVGSIYQHDSNNKMVRLLFSKDEDGWEYVKAIDGLIMITQYDIHWREDLFDGWHFYDLSQSMEFKSQGYDIVVPNKHKPWCIHDCGKHINMNDFDKYRSIYISEYRNYLDEQL